MQLKRREIKHFKNITDLCSGRKNVIYNESIENITLLIKEFERNFVEFDDIEDVAKAFVLSI